MAIETRPDQEQTAEAVDVAELAAGAFDALLEYGREHGYQLDWMQKRETFGDALEAHEEAGGLLL